VDIDAFVAVHAGEWARLEKLVRRARRPRRLSGAEIDELVLLYQRVATHLSILQTRSPDPVLVARLSRLVANARAAVAGAHVPAWRTIASFFTVTFPVAVYRSRRWWVTCALVSLAVAFALGLWVDTHPDVQRSLAPPNEVRDLVNHQFADYYSAHPAHDFAAQVWTNNVWVSAEVLVGGLTFGLLTIYSLLANVVNVGVIGGFMAAAGKLGLFFGLLAPHGVLELTAVFVASGAGLRLGWTTIDPGPRPRSDAIAKEGRSTVVIALGLVVVLAVSGVIEAFVTPSGLPTWARIGIGLFAEALFLTYVWTLGRRAALAGVTGDLAEDLAGAVQPVSG
jgi:uncharacterized membrane protein SpoIIM required for sporulation